MRHSPKQIISEAFLRRILFLLPVSLVVSGCAYVAQDAELNPEVNYQASSMGTGVIISVHVKDERPTESLGKRQEFGAEITTEQDVARVVADEIRKGLAANGFQLKEYDASDPVRIDAELRLLEYSTSTGFFTGGIHVNAALKINAEKDGSKYDNFYRIEKEVRVVVVPFGEQNEAYINQGLVLLMEKMFADDTLLDFLTT